MKLPSPVRRLLASLVPRLIFGLMVLTLVVSPPWLGRAVAAVMPADPLASEGYLVLAVINFYVVGHVLHRIMFPPPRK